MGNFKYMCMDEAKQFLFLCGEKDRKILLSRKKKDKIDELARLACISLVFCYKTMFLRIFGETQKYFDEFINGIDRVNGNFILLSRWVEEFIDNIEDGTAKEISVGLWQNRKKTLDRPDLLVKHLFVSLNS